VDEEGKCPREKPSSCRSLISSGQSLREIDKLKTFTGQHLPGGMFMTAPLLCSLCSTFASSGQPQDAFPHGSLLKELILSSAAACCLFMVLLLQQAWGFCKSTHGSGNKTARRLSACSCHKRLFREKQF